MAPVDSSIIIIIVAGATFFLGFLLGSGFIYMLMSTDNTHKDVPERDEHEEFVEAYRDDLPSFLKRQAD